MSIQDTLTTLVEGTAQSPNGTSVLPLDLQVTAIYLRTVVDYYTRALGEGITDVVLATTVCDVLIYTNIYYGVLLTKKIEVKIGPVILVNRL